MGGNSLFLSLPVQESPLLWSVEYQQWLPLLGTYCVPGPRAKVFNRSPVRPSELLLTEAHFTYEEREASGRI